MTQLRRPVMRYFGGKWRLAPWILQHFPKHDVYVEPYGGGASVLMRKDRSRTEIYNDLDEEIVNVFRVLRNKRNAVYLEKALRLTLFSRSEFNLAYKKATTHIERARRTIVRSFMSHGGDGTTRKHRSGFRSKTFESNRDASKDWQNYFDAIPTFVERLQGVIVENNNALDVMTTNDSEKTLFYCDPPYPLGSRSSKEKHGYRHEMTNDDHVALIAHLNGLKGMVILSGYANEIYGSMDGWHSVSCEALADGAVKRTEVLWLNNAAFKAQDQMSLFDGGDQ